MLPVCLESYARTGAKGRTQHLFLSIAQSHAFTLATSIISILASTPSSMTSSVAPWTVGGIVAWETRFGQESLERCGLQQDRRTVQL